MAVLDGRRSATDPSQMKPRHTAHQVRFMGLFCLLASATFCALPLGRDIRFGRSRSLTCCSTLNVTLIKSDLLAGISSHGLRS
jgi:hypothetical protein